MRTIFLFCFGLCFYITHYGKAQQTPNNAAIKYQSARPDQTFQVFQFPRDQIPRIDGKKDDWQMVPANYTYGTDQLKDTEDGMGANIDPEDLDVKVTVGWVKGLIRLYILYEAYDDYWDFGRFNPDGYLNDIFEIVVDGDFSGDLSSPIHLSKALGIGATVRPILPTIFNLAAYMRRITIFIPHRSIMPGRWCGAHNHGLPIIYAISN